MILCTGTEGFIGKHLTNALYPRPILCIESRQPPQCALIIEETLKTFGPDIEAVFHLGAISDTTCEDGDALRETNIVFSGRLADFCESKNIPFVYASSASVYGNGNGPLNQYAHSKWFFDEKVMQPARWPMPWYGLRFFNVYGPGEEHKGKQMSMVSQLIREAKEEGSATLFDIDAKRDFVHVDDIISVMIWMWKNRPASGIYDVGTGIAEPFEAIPMAIAKLTNKNLNMVRIPFPESLKGKYQFHTQADLTKLRAAGYSAPFLTLEEGIERMLT